MGRPECLVDVRVQSRGEGVNTRVCAPLVGVLWFFNGQRRCMITAPVYLELKLHVFSVCVRIIYKVIDCIGRIFRKDWAGKLKGVLMRKKSCFLWALIGLCAVLAVSVQAKETEIYFNDFSDSSSLSDFTLNGNWAIGNGGLTAGSGSGSAYLTYTLPNEYTGKNFRVEVDFLGHTSTGGILIGGIGGPSVRPKTFFGYDFFISADAQKGAMGCYDATGAWGGNITVGLASIRRGADLHLSVTVRGKELTYLVTSLDGTVQYFGMTYDIGTSSKDIYSAIGNQIGLRKFYNDAGTFDNFRVTVLEDDVLPELSQSASFAGMAVQYGGSLEILETEVRGTGALLSADVFAEDFAVECELEAVGATRFVFGATDMRNYFVFEINREEERVYLYQVINGKFKCMGSKNVPVRDGVRTVRIEVLDKYVKLYFEDNFNDYAPFPKFDMRLGTYRAGNFGIWLDGGCVSALTFSEPRAYAGKTHTNPVTVGADPDVLYYDGVYYLYNRISDGNNVFRVHTSTDLVNWTSKNVVFTHKAEYKTSSYMSPNVFYHDGLFYLLYAEKNSEGNSRLYYAVASSPYGPFEPATPGVPLHDVSEIGGHPFIDDDGKIYLSYVRFGGGNFIWMEEVAVADGVITPKSGTLTLLISPTDIYETDGYGLISEGGVIHKHNGLYYMIYATGHYKGHYGEGYAVAENVLGPYTKYQYNDILTYNSAVDGVGDGVFVTSPDGSELYMVYHQHSSTNLVEPRYTCIDLVKFVPDENGGPDILYVYGPTTTPQPYPANIYKDDFNRDGRVTLADVFLVSRYIMSNAGYSAAYDPNADGKSDLSDIMYLMKIIATGV